MAGRRSAASTGGMTAFNAAATTATSSAPQKLSMLTPGSSPAATIRATPVASHEAISGNSRKRGRSGRHAVDWPYSGSASLGIRFSSRVWHARRRDAHASPGGSESTVWPRAAGSHHPGGMKPGPAARPWGAGSPT